MAEYYQYKPVSAHGLRLSIRSVVETNGRHLPRLVLLPLGLTEKCIHLYLFKATVPFVPSYESLL